MMGCKRCGIKIDGMHIKLQLTTSLAPEHKEYGYPKTAFLCVRCGNLASRENTGQNYVEQYVLTDVARELFK